MPERSSERKARRDSRDSPCNSADESEAASLRTEFFSSISYKHSVFGNLSSKNCFFVRKNRKRNRSKLRSDWYKNYPVDLCVARTWKRDPSRKSLQGDNSVHPARHPDKIIKPATTNLKYTDNIAGKLPESLINMTQQNLGIPKLPKSLLTTWPTFDRRKDKFAHFGVLFMTTLKVYVKISQEEKKMLIPLPPSRRCITNVRKYDVHESCQPRRHNSHFPLQVRTSPICRNHQIEMGTTTSPPIQTKSP